MTKLYEEYLNEIVIFGSPKGRNICQEIEEKHTRELKNEVLKCKYSSNDKNAICKCLIVIKHKKQMISEYIKRSDECEGNSTCLKIIQMSINLVKRRIKEIEDQVKYIKSHSFSKDDEYFEYPLQKK